MEGRQVHRLVQKLIEIRKDRKITQEAVAKIVGVGRPTISLWENGHASPQLDDIERYAKAVGVTIEYQVAEI